VLAVIQSIIVRDFAMARRNLRLRPPDILAAPFRLGLKIAAAKRPTRIWLNRVYVRLTPHQRELFYRAFAKIYRHQRITFQPGIWTVEFGGRLIKLPLSDVRAWLDWDIALSIVGHDVAIAQTYLHLLDSTTRPDLFVDIGANYGTHSLLFLAHGVETLSFEPNSSCREYFFQACALNKVVPHLESVALGSEPRETILSYPRRDTWLGTVRRSPDIGDELGSDVRIETVRQARLDDYLEQLRGRRVLLKVDTEGSECDVFRGASRVLSELRPMVIFESWPSADRAPTFDLLTRHGYQLFKLPWNPALNSVPLVPSRLLATRGNNFLAISAKAGGPARHFMRVQRV
jgi:FkbM family methyltransferase